MNDANLLDIIQTLAVVAALLFTGYEIRARSREQQFRNYLDSMYGFLDATKLLVEREELHALYDESPEDRNKDKTYSELSSDERARVHYCDMIIGLCETVWLAGERGWLPKDEWRYWKGWAEELKQSPDFSVDPGMGQR